MKYEIDNDEVIIYEGGGYFNKEHVSFKLTSKKMIFEKEQGFFKKEKVVVAVVPLENIKIFNGVPEVKQSYSEVKIQSVEGNITLYFDNMISARNATAKIMNVLTGTTTAERGSGKVKKAIDLVDETLGIDTKGILRGVTEKGLKGTLIGGFKKKDKKD